jgi:hypothetical protein
LALAAVAGVHCFAPDLEVVVVKVIMCHAYEGVVA